MARAEVRNELDLTVSFLFNPDLKVVHHITILGRFASPLGLALCATPSCNESLLAPWRDRCPYPSASSHFSSSLPPRCPPAPGSSRTPSRPTRQSLVALCPAASGSTRRTCSTGC